MSQVWAVHAGWLIPVSGPPQRHGFLVIAGDRIAGLGPSIPEPYRDACRVCLDLRDAIVLPGLVNAHTHLDLGGMATVRRNATVPPAFCDWLRQVVAYRRTSAQQDWRAAVRQGLEQSLRCGVTLLGDVTADGGSLEEIVRSPVQAVVFHEVLGLTKARAKQTWEQACAWLSRRDSWPNVRQGLSPHAPYSVRRGLFRLALHRCQQDNLRLMTHVAETPEEAELLDRHRGPLRDFLETLGAWDEAGLLRGTERLRQLLNRDRQVIWVHCNYLVQPPPGYVVWCPRTHAWFGHPRHRFAEWMNRGSVVALGTDSLASSPDLDLLAEARFVYKHYPEVQAPAVIRMATMSGAEVLGWADSVGTLEAGKLADWIAIRVPQAQWEKLEANPEDAVLRHPWPVTDVCVGGKLLIWEGRAVADNENRPESAARGDGWPTPDG
jgi:cytosine/adenosine deaminase-related metal-dependent hydrolase